MIVSDNWAEAMLPTLREVYELSGGKERDYIAEICGRSTSTLQYEQTLGIGSIGLMDNWDDVGRTTSYEDVEKGHKTTYTHDKFVKAVTIERDWVDDNQYTKIANIIKDVRRSGHNTQQHQFAALFNNAWNADSDYALADGYSLAYDSHTYNSAGTGGTFDNNATSTALTADNLEAIRTKILTDWKDDKGNLLNIDPEDLILLVPTALRKTALVIADSDGEPDVSDNNVNVWKGAIDVIEWPRLTSTTAWFVIVRSQARKLCHWYDRRPISFSSNIDWDTEAARYRIIGRWSKGSDCPPAWVYCCKA